MSLKGSVRRLEQNNCKRPHSSWDVPVGHQRPSGTLRVWTFTEVIQVFWVSLLNIYTWTEGHLRVHCVFNGKSSLSSFSYCVYLPLTDFSSKTQNWLRWDKINSCARRNYCTREMIMWHLVVYAIMAWYFQDSIHLLFCLRLDFPLRLCNYPQAAHFTGWWYWRVSKLGIYSSLSSGQCSSWLSNKHDCQVCPQLFRRWPFPWKPDYKTVP